MANETEEIVCANTLFYIKHDSDGDGDGDGAE